MVHILVGRSCFTNYSLYSSGISIICFLNVSIRLLASEDQFLSSGLLHGNVSLFRYLLLSELVYNFIMLIAGCFLLFQWFGMITIALSVSSRRLHSLISYALEKHDCYLALIGALAIIRRAFSSIVVVI